MSVNNTFQRTAWKSIDCETGISATAQHRYVLSIANEGGWLTHKSRSSGPKLNITKDKDTSEHHNITYERLREKYKLSQPDLINSSRTNFLILQGPSTLKFQQQYTPTCSNIFISHRSETWKLMHTSPNWRIELSSHSSHFSTFYKQNQASSYDLGSTHMRVSYLFGASVLLIMGNPFTHTDILF